LFAFADDKLIDPETALKITTGFGGGIAKEGQVCGAFTAGVMLLGLVYGRGQNDQESNKEKTYQKVQDFIEIFKIENKSIICKDILMGCDLKTEEGKSTFNTNNYHAQICEKCVSNAVSILQKYL
jgi:C_GCAxxG_C_C family probable redox protein